MTEKNNFFSILFSVCSGTKIFTRIINFRLLKTFWHLILLGIICSFIFTAVSSPNMKKEILDTCNYLQNQFGNIIVKKDGVYPQLNPNKSRNLNYRYLQFDYAPSLKDINNIKINSDMNYSGFIWTPKSIVGWMKLNDNEVILYPAVTNLDSTKLFKFLSKDKIDNYAKSNSLTDFNNLLLKICAQGDIPIVGFFSLDKINSFTGFANSIFYWSAGIVLVRFFFTIIINALLYSLIFAAVYKFTGKKTLYNLNFKKFFSIAIYASFPAIIIGTLLELAQPPWFQYQTIFIFAFVIYLIVVTNRLRKSPHV
ncbi:MAG TPA: hypothetical protein QF753_17690 [Victivallales bacterium]|nr:hypothetical protein [Victivallales bacterium]